MKLTKVSIERPLTILMVILALIIMGLRGYSMMTVDRFPKTDIPMVSIVTNYSGAAATDIEEEIVKKIEDEVAGISGVDSMYSTAQEGSATTRIEFVDSVDTNQAASDVERAVSKIKGDLPEDADEPTVIKANTQSMPIMNLVLSSDGSRSLAELYSEADDNIKARLLAVPGVASVSVTGGEEAEVQVQVDPIKMAAYHLSFQDLATTLEAENVSTPVGSVSIDTNRLAVRSIGRFRSLQNIEDLVVSSSGQQIRLKDIATVAETHKEVEELLRLNGQETVGLSITKQSDANSVSTADGVKRALETIRRSLPEGMTLTLVTDDTDFTRDSVNAVQTDLILAVFITGAVLLCFLHVLRSTVIVLLAVPTSLITTFLVMWGLGFSLNTLTLLALALTIGILVDDSIVVLENIFTHLNRGEPPNEAALNGRSEIGLAAIAITLTDIVVYVPVAFTTGMVGMLFRQYGITIAVATFCSLLVSFTLTPMLASLWLKREAEHRGGLRGKLIALWDRSYGALANFYAGVLDWGLYHRPVVIFVAVLAMAGAVAFIPLRLVGTEFAPSSDDGKISGSVLMVAGTSLQGTNRAMLQIEEILKSIPEVKDVLAQVGSSGGSGIGPSSSGSGVGSGSLTIKLVDKKLRQRSIWEVVNEIRGKVQSIASASVQLSTSTGLGGGGGGQAGLQIQVKGPEMATLIDLAKKVEEVMRAVPGVVDVQNAEAEGSPEWQINLDRQRMKDLNITSAEVGSALRTAMSGSAVSTLQREGRTELDITLIANEQARQQTDEIERVPLKFTKGGNPITIGQIGQLVKSTSASQIKRVDRQRTLTVTGNVTGRALGDVNDDIMAAIRKQVQVPADYQVGMAGMAEQQGTAFSSLYSALTLSIVLMYMLMVALFESFMQPLAIMFSLPVAMVGAFGGLLITENTLNIFSLLGIIMLIGLVTKNAILLVDFTDVLRKRGMPRHQALVQAGRMRLRPILMTTAAMVFAMIPFVLKLEAGSESRAPLAAVVIGGTITSTLLTLVLVPAVYTYLDSVETFVRRKFLHKAPRFVEKTDGQQPLDEATPQYGYGAGGE